MNKRVSVFGSSMPNPGDQAYEEALHLGRLLGRNGYTVLTGGYIGTMQAVSQGAAESGAYVIGVTCEEIEAYRPVGPNRWLSEEIRFSTLRERVFTLISECDAAIALPGGVGTFLEIITMWNNLIINALDPRPLLLAGSGWKTTIRIFFETMGPYLSSSQREIITFVPDIESAVTTIAEI